MVRKWCNSLNERNANGEGNKIHSQTIYMWCNPKRRLCCTPYTVSRNPANQQQLTFLCDSLATSPLVILKTDSQLPESTVWLPHHNKAPWAPWHLVPRGEIIAAPSWWPILPSGSAAWGPSCTSPRSDTSPLAGGRGGRQGGTLVRELAFQQRCVALKDLSTSTMSNS